MAPALTSTPNILDRREFSSPSPVRVEVVALVQEGRGGARFFEVNVAGTKAYLFSARLPYLKPAPSERELQQGCVLPTSPEETAARIEALVAEREKFDREQRESLARMAAETAEQQREAERRAKLPGVKIGMTAKQVREETSWGPPQSINRTSTAGAVDEQWVYEGRNYLYLRNGRVRAIQN
jgi:hypothetical protein